MSQRTFTTLAIVLKRRDSGECDRHLTVLTQDQGKLSGIAKGCRRINSSKLSALEPGNIVELFWARSQGAPLITQAKVVWSVSSLRSNLHKLRQLSQVLEIVDTLFSEGQAESELFDEVAGIVQSIEGTTRSFEATRSRLQQLVISLGYAGQGEENHESLLDYVSTIADKKLKSFEYLTVRRYNTA